MSRLVIRNLDFLNSIAKSSGDIQIKLVKQATEDNIKSIQEIALNVLQGNLGLTNEEKNNLKKHKVLIRKLSSKKIGFKKKIYWLLQRIEILKYLLIPFLSAVGSVIGKVIASNF